MKHKTIFTVLTVALFMVLLVFSVFAADTSGSCGDNLTWMFDSTTGVLTISGQGNMEFNMEYAPWGTFQNSIVRVVIDEGCTEIYERAFVYCSKLTSVSLPASLERIGPEAFMYCSQLKTVLLSDGLTTIERNAFKECRSLGSVTLPNSVTTIGDGAFAQCSNMETFDMGNGVTELGTGVFSNCNSLISLRISDKVTELKQDVCYHCTTLQEVTLGASVAWVDTKAFDDCPSLTKLTLSSANNKLIVDRGVAVYAKDRMELLFMLESFSGAYTVLPGTTKIMSEACEGNSITELTVPSSVMTIEYQAFSCCENLKVLKLTEGLQEIGGEAFEYTAIEELKIPKSVTSISGKAFRGCMQLKNITVEGPPPNHSEHEYDAVFSGVTATLHYPGGYVDWLGAKLFFGEKLTLEPYFCSVHTPMVVPGITATCEKSGLTDGKRCSVCGEFLEEQKGVPKAAHQFGPWQEVNMGIEVAQSYKIRYCTVCSYPETEMIFKPGDPVAGVTNPTQPQPIPTQPVETQPVGTQPVEPTEPTQGQFEPTVSTQPVGTETTEPTTSEPASTDASKPANTDATEPIAIDDGTAWNTVALIAKVVLLVGAVAAAAILFFRKTRK